VGQIINSAGAIFSKIARQTQQIRGLRSGGSSVARDSILLRPDSPWALVFKTIFIFFVRPLEVGQIIYTAGARIENFSKIGQNGPLCRGSPGMTIGDLGLIFFVPKSPCPLVWETVFDFQITPSKVGQMMENVRSPNHPAPPALFPLYRPSWGSHIENLGSIPPCKFNAF